MIYLDSYGMEQLQKAIKEAREKLRAKTHEKAESDNDEIVAEIAGLQYQLKALMRDLGETRIVDAHEEIDRVDIGDVVTLHNKAMNDTFKVKLTANYHSNQNFNAPDEIDEISLNSPIGRAIFRKKVGDEISYSVEKREFSAKIVDFVRPEVKIKIKILEKEEMTK